MLQDKRPLLEEPVLQQHLEALQKAFKGKATKNIYPKPKYTSFRYGRLSLLYTFREENRMCPVDVSCSHFKFGIDGHVE